MALDFEPCYYPNNPFDGTDVRNGNGELKGFTAKTTKNGKTVYRARLSDGLNTRESLGEFDTDDQATDAIILHYAG